MLFTTGFAKFVSNSSTACLMFSASPKGAAASAAVYSIVETSKANDLEPFRYLTYLFEKLPNINFKTHPEVLEDFLHWSKEVQQKCK